MANITEEMTKIYVFADDYLKKHAKLAHWRRSANQRPEFTDAEVITIGLMQSVLGVTTLKKAYQQIRDNYQDAFPKLCSYQQWIARLHKLSDIIGHLVEAARQTDGFAYSLYLIDSKPIPVCKPIRHWTTRLLREAGAYFGKTSKGWFFGFKLHTLCNIDGHIVGAVLTPANYHDREAALALALAADGGITLGDCVYGGEETCESLAQEAELLMITRKAMPEQKALISSVRQNIETFLGQLCHLFIDLVYSRSWLGLWTTIKLKLLAYNLSHAGFICLD